MTGYDVTRISNDLYKETDFTFSGRAEVTGTDAGSYDMELKPADFTNISDNFTNVEFVIVDGQLVINPIEAEVKITGHHDAVTYDGSEHTVTGYDVAIGSELYSEADFTFSGTAEAKRTEVGTTDMGLAADQFTNTNGNFSRVTFTVTDGYLTIVPVDEVLVTIIGHNDTVGYDGTEHTVTGYDVEISNPGYREADFTFSGTAEAKRTDAGTTAMGLAADQFANTNTVFGQVTFLVTDGSLTVTPKAAIIRTGSAEKVYDGTPLTESTATIEGLVEGESVTLRATGTITDVGTVDNTYEITWDNAKESNYSVTEELGKLTVKQPKYTLTIRYWLGGRVISTLKRTRPAGTAYNVVTPTREGYVADIARVKGILTEDKEYDVVYTQLDYTLTINYLYQDGTVAAAAHTETLHYRDAYSVASPVIAGYHTADRTVSGVMPARDVTVTVIYVADATNLITIEDLETPLGLGLGSLNAGETIE